MPLLDTHSSCINSLWGVLSQASWMGRRTTQRLGQGQKERGNPVLLINQNPLPIFHERMRNHIAFLWKLPTVLKNGYMFHIYGQENWLYYSFCEALEQFTVWSPCLPLSKINSLAEFPFTWKYFLMHADYFIHIVISIKCIVTYVYR